MRRQRMSASQAEWPVLRELLVCAYETQLADFIRCRLARLEDFYAVIAREYPQIMDYAACMLADDRHLINLVWEQLHDGNIDDTIWRYHTSRTGDFRAIDCARFAELTAGRFNWVRYVRLFEDEVVMRENDEAIDELRAFRKVIERCDAIMQQLTLEEALCKTTLS